MRVDGHRNVASGASATQGCNSVATEYRLAIMWGFIPLMKTAPVSREMILGFVAQCSLGLPKSFSARA